MPKHKKTSASQEVNDEAIHNFLGVMHSLVEKETFDYQANEMEAYANILAGWSDLTQTDKRELEKRMLDKTLFPQELAFLACTRLMTILTNRSLASSTLYKPAAMEAKNLSPIQKQRLTEMTAFARNVQANATKKGHGGHSMTPEQVARRRDILRTQHDDAIEEYKKAHQTTTSYLNFYPTSACQTDKRKSRSSSTSTSTASSPYSTPSRSPKRKK